MQTPESIRQKINSIDTISKITNAMQLVATVKLRRYFQIYEKNKDFLNGYYELIANIISSCSKKEFLSKNPNAPTLYCVISSAIGFCGPFNNNVSKLVMKEIKDKDKVYIIGGKGVSNWTSQKKDKHIYKVNKFYDMNLTYDFVDSFSSELYEDYISGKFGKIVLAYTKYLNALNFKASLMQLLPIDLTYFVGRKSVDFDENKIIFEPSKSEIIENITREIFTVFLYGGILESKVCENASRRVAMEKATKNAKELIDKYKLIYKRIRQANITQGISEVISFSNAKTE